MGHFPGTPPITSAHGGEVDKLIWFLHILMAVLFVGWLIYFLLVLYKFRQSRNPQASYQGAKGKFSTYLEVGVAAIEGILLLGLSVPIWVEAVEKWPAEDRSVVIEVMARQFNWTARYAGPDGKFGNKDPKFVSASDPFGIDRKSEGGTDDVVVVNDLYVPVNTPVIVKLTSLDVIHSFGVHSLRVMQDAIPGMMIPLHFTATHTGTNVIECAQLCGNSHYAMKGHVIVVSQPEFQEWLQSRAPKSSAPAVDYE